jgi:hypothetical protein
MRLEGAMVARAAHSPCDASDSAPDRSEALSTYASRQRRQRAVRAGPTHAGCGEWREMPHRNRIVR